MTDTIIHMLVMPKYKAGDPAPSGHLQWHEWAEVQERAGLRSKQCVRCKKWHHPQSMSKATETVQKRTRKGLVNVDAPVCIKCDNEQKGQA